MLHTFMDYLREEGTREINHHGQTVTVGDGDGEEKLFQKSEKIPTYEDMTQRNEKDLVEARKGFYANAVTFKINYLKICQFAAMKGIPLTLIVFSTLYWAYGLYFFFNPAV